ncbi:MAG: TPR end-of-group domain-containing protein [Pyrinomonadaceae bacterium]
MFGSLMPSFQGVAATAAATPAGSRKTAIKKLTILPFDAEIDDAETTFLGFALAAEISAKLSQLGSVATRAYEGGKHEATESLLVRAAGESDADYALTGSYRKEKDRLLLHARLVDVRQGETLWSALLETAYSDLRRLPELLCRRIIAALDLALSPAEDRRLRTDRSADGAAYELYLRATALRPVTADDWRRCRELLERAIRRAPAYAPALAALGNAHMQYASKTGGGARHYKRAETILRRALSLDGESPPTLASLASLYAKTGKSEEAAALLHRALRPYPNSASFHAALGYTYRYAGLLDESINAYRQAQTLDASRASLHDHEEQIVKALIYRGDYRAALVSHEKIAASREAAGQPDEHKELFYAGVSHFYLKEYDKATRLFDEAAQLDAPSIWSAFGRAYKAAAEGDGTRLLELTKELETRDIVDGERRYRLAHFYALAGRRAAALYNLRKAIEGGFFNYPYISRDPLLASISGSDEFKLLLRQAKRRHETFRLKFGGRERSQRGGIRVPGFSRRRN